ncbi:MAG: hypothetical protein J6B71_10595 [Clostridia bacterium]|nr:hypothetical protein [Clostridia bacterium]
MENQNIVVVKKKSTFWTVVKILLIVGAVCLVAAKIYQKFFKKKTVEVLEDADDLAALDAADEVPTENVVEAEETFEVPAEAVIANAEDMEDTAPVAEV